MEITLFEPTQFDFRKEHPELMEHPEFVGLSADEMKFVWYYANQTSPYVGFTKKYKNRICYDNSFKIRNDAQKKRYYVGDFDAHVIAAINVMGKFSPSDRMRGKMMVSKILTKFENYVETGQLVKLEDGTIADDLLKTVDQKEYIDQCKKIIEVLPELIHKNEFGFGIRVKDKQEKKTTSYADDIMSSINKE